MIRCLKRFQVDGDFAGVRDDALKTLPAEQAESWRQLWEQVQATLKQFDKRE